MDQEYIVGEVSRNWSGSGKDKGKLVSQLFEHLIAINLKRGYTLHSFAVHATILEKERLLNETIIAVFRRRNTDIESPPWAEP